MFDIFYVSKEAGSDSDWEKIKAKYPRAHRISHVKNYQEVRSKALTRLFWVIWDDITLCDSFNLNEFRPDKWDEIYIHVFKNGSKFNGVCLIPKSAGVSQREFNSHYFMEKKEVDIMASVPKIYDVVFISYNEPHADQNYQRLLEICPRAKRVHGVKGIHQAHIKAAEVSDTPMFWVVDGDAVVDKGFDFDFMVPEWEHDSVFVWRSKNPVNGLEYGNGGVKLMPKKLTLSITPDTVDMTTSIARKFKPMESVSNINSFNVDEFTTWRSAFRECCKLASRVIEAQVDADTQHRLDVWCTVGEDNPYGKYAIAGARLGKEYGLTNKGNVEALQKINDFGWLRDTFEKDSGIRVSIPSDNEPESAPKKDTMCVIPWVHLNFEPNGKVVPCCLTSYHDYFAGDLNKQTVEEVWNSDNMKKLRKQFLNGEEPSICSTCFNRERVTGDSARIFHNRDYKRVIDIIPEITNSDGSCKEMKLKYWDFRFSNLCNFKCRSCGPRYSSAWVPDAKKLGHADQEKVWSIEQVGNTPNYDFLQDQVQHVERIYFAGGEPLMMPEHWQILDMLVKNKRFDVRISYNTNASMLSYGKKNVLDYWKQWEDWKLEVWPSIDEIGERAELIRSGTVWHKVEENLKKITALDNVWIRPGITVGAWNVRRLPTIINHLIEIGVIKEKYKHQNFFLNMLMMPEHYHVQVLPDDYRQETIAELKAFIDQHNKKYDTSIDHLFVHIMHELEKPYDKAAAQRFVLATEQIDNLRNESMYDVVPEMKIVRDRANEK